MGATSRGAGPPLLFLLLLLFQASSVRPPVAGATVRALSRSIDPFPLRQGTLTSNRVDPFVPALLIRANSDLLHPGPRERCPHNR